MGFETNFNKLKAVWKILPEDSSLRSEIELVSLGVFAPLEDKRLGEVFGAIIGRHVDLSSAGRNDGWKRDVVLAWIS